MFHTVVPPDPARLVVPTIPRRPQQNNRNAVECVVVDLVIDRVVERLTNRAGGRRPPPWSPNQQVRVGVLRPTAARMNQRAAVDSSTLGIDFVVGSPRGIETVDLEIDVVFALYQPLFPTRQEVLETMRREGRYGEGDGEGANGIGGQGGNDAGRGAASSGSRSVRNLPITEAWERTEVNVPQLHLRVPVNGTHAGHEVSPMLDEATVEAVRRHFARRDAARAFTTGGRTVPISALDSNDSYLEALRGRVDPDWNPQVPTPRVHAFAESLPDGALLISVSLINETEPREGDRLQDLAVYDAHIEVRMVAGGTIDLQRFRLAPDDYRYEDLAGVIGHGRGCVAVNGRNGGVATETLPFYIQQAVHHRTDHLPPLRWDDLATDPGPVLLRVEEAMRTYLQEWDDFLPTLHGEARLASERDRDHFRAEIERFEVGRHLLDVDPDLLHAFRLANRVFARAGRGPGYSSWRPFQIVYMTSHLSALAARRHRDRADLVAEMEFADVLWFPTGGGKTEAYLGLIVVALFYDRLRGKRHGTTALLRFPLRMLSAQQLERILRVVVFAESVRQEGDAGGAPFELGYLVGGSNTPNVLRYEEKWWPGMAHAHRLTETDRRRHRLIASCPVCETHDSVTLSPDQDLVRILHVCTVCDARLPVHISDEEVYRFQPAVIVSTLDKVVGFAHFGEFTSFNHGPVGSCPEHGYFSFDGCNAAGCTVPARQMAQVTDWNDPVPTIIVQDELHLVAEELGAFAAHFESLLAELQRGGPSGLPSKILAASATIQGFSDQVRQVYGRRARRFPSPGYDRRRGFYTVEMPEVRRAFLGVMPTGGGTSKVETAGRIQAEFVRAVQDLQDDPNPLRPAVTEVLGSVPTDNELRDWLFDFEVSLGYVNRRADGARIADDLRDLDRDLQSVGHDGLRHELLTADVPIAELASAIARVERATSDQPRDERLRALVGTSVVSHGVDLERLNLMTMTGLPPTTADYIQATSRIGRSHVGLVVAVFDHFSLRESSTFTHFLSTHAFLDRLVEQVPVNKYGRLAISRSLSALVMSLLWDLARDPALNPPTVGIRRTRDFRPWWNTRANLIRPRLDARLQRAVRAAIPAVADAGLEEQLALWAEEHWETRERPALERFANHLVKDCFETRVLTSLRDVDEPALFAADARYGPAFEALS